MPDLRASHLHEKAELNELVEVLKKVKLGDFSVRVAYEKGDSLSRVGELLNDIIALNEQTANELVYVGKVVGQEGRMTSARRSAP